MKDMNECSVCYDQLDFENSVRYQCNHSFCVNCTKAIVFEQDDSKCPLDRISIRFLHHKDQSRHINQYKIDLWNCDRDSIMIKFENFVSELFKSSIKTINTIDIVLNHPGLEFCSYIEKINNVVDTFRKDLKQIVLSDTCYSAGSIIFLTKKIFQGISKDDLPAFEFNLYRNPIFYRIRYLLVNLMYFRNFISDKAEAKKIMLVQYVNDKKNFITALIISHLTNNGNIYKMARTRFKEIDIDRCLTCCSIINEMEFASFSQCHHKICINCVVEFMITHASCPVHSGEILHLNWYKTKEPVLSYMCRNYREIASRLFNKSTNDNIPYIKTIFEIQSIIPTLMEASKTFKTTGCSVNQYKEIINTLQTIQIPIQLSHKHNSLHLSDDFDLLDNFKLLKEIIPNPSANRYIDTTDVFINDFRSFTISCISILNRFDKLLSKPLRSIGQLRANLELFLFHYKLFSNEISEWEIKEVPDRFCDEVYDLMVNLKNVVIGIE